MTGHLVGLSAEVIVSTSSLLNTFVFSKGYLESAQLSVATCGKTRPWGREVSRESLSYSIWPFYYNAGTRIRCVGLMEEVAGVLLNHSTIQI